MRRYILAAAAAACALPAAGVTQTWSGAGSNNWASAGNWTSAVPVAGDTAILDGLLGTNYPVVLNASAPGVLAAVHVDNGAALNLSATLSTTLMHIRNSSGTSDSIVTLLAGATLNAATLDISNFEFGPVARLDMQAGRIDSTSLIRVGNIANGELYSTGGSITGVEFLVGKSGGYGFVQMDNSSLAVQTINAGIDEFSSGEIQFGSATFTPVSLSVNFVNLGVGGASANGTLQLNGGVNATLGQIIVGQDGVGNFSGYGTQMTSGNVYVGAAASAQGYVNFTATTWTLNGFLQIGGEGYALVELGENTNTTVNGVVDVSTFAGSQGFLRVYAFGDAGAQFIANQQIRVATGNDGAMTVEGSAGAYAYPGSSPTNSSLVVGPTAGFTGTLTLQSGGQFYSDTGVANIGFAGKGILDIQTSGLLQTKHLVVARNPGSEGVVTVQNFFSRLAVALDADLGGTPADFGHTAGGLAHVRITDEAVLEIGRTLTVFPSGTLIIDNNATGIVGDVSTLTPLPNTLVVGDGGRLAGGGNVLTSLRIQPLGAVAPGIDGNSTAVLKIGGSVQLAGGVIEIDLGGLTPGTQHDKLDVAGSFNPTSGVININVLNTYAPAAGDLIRIVAFASSSATPVIGFGGTPLPGGLSWNTTLFPINGSVAVVGVGGLPQWNQAAGGSWNAGGNWAVALPNAAGAAANFLAVGAASPINIASPVVAGTLNFSGTNNYTINGSTLTLQSPGLTGIFIAGGNQAVLAPITLANSATFLVPAGATLTTAAVTGGQNLLVAGAGLVAVSRLDLGTVIIASGGTLRLRDSGPGEPIEGDVSGTGFNGGNGNTPGAGSTSFIAALSLAGGFNAWTSTLDIRNNDLVIRNNSDIDTTRDLVAYAYNGGLWDRPGITSSRAAADGLAVGYGSNVDLGYTIFSGVAVATDDMLIKYTWFGDANLDGQVDGDDYLLWLAVFGSNGTGIGWGQGDFDYDQDVDGDDYLLWLQNFGNGIGSPLAVPEPALLGLAAMSAGALLARRRRR